MALKTYNRLSPEPIHQLQSASPVVLDATLADDILYNLPGFIFWKNRKFQYIGFNRNVAELFGLTRHELKGKTDQELNWDPLTAERFQKEEQQVIETGIPKISEQEMPVKRADGTPIIVRTEKSRLLDRSGNIIGVLCVAVDITEEKILEKKIQTLQSNPEQEVLYNLEYIISHMPGYIYWKDKNSRYMGCNQGVAKASGLATPKEIIGKTDYDFQWGAKEAAQFIEDDQKVMAEEITLTTEYTLPIQRESGQELIVRTDKMPFYNNQGEVVGVLAIAVDVTEQKMLEKALREEKERVESLSQMKTFFIRNMEHDIRTPFGGIYTLADTLAHQEEDAEKKEYLLAISQCAKELLDYCNNILDFSRLESGTLPLISKKFDLKSLIDGIIKIEIPAARARNLALTIEYGDNVPEIVIGDPYRLQRIFINLISNAIKFTHEGYVSVKVALPKIHPTNDTQIVVRFFIEDTGIGISKENQMRIYEPLQKITPENKILYRGSGLGLTIVKQLLNELNGEIDVQSVVNEGTTIACTIPFKQPLINDIVYNDDIKISTHH